MIAWYFVTNLLKNSTISVKQEQKIQEMKMEDYSKESLEEMR